MSDTARAHLTVAQVLNNNVVIAVDPSGARVIAQGKGIGFSRTRGDLIPPDAVRTVFRADDTEQTLRDARALTTVAPEYISLAKIVLDRSGFILDEATADSALIHLADHVQNAVRLAGISAGAGTHPLRWEVQALYPAETQAACTAIETIREYTNVALPSHEETALALHFVSAQLPQAAVSEAVEFTKVLDRALGAIQESAAGQFTIDTGGIGVSRFATHMRFLLLRLTHDLPEIGAPSHLLDSVLRESPGVGEAVDRIAELLEQEWSVTIKDSERAYIALHVFRLIQESTR